MKKVIAAALGLVIAVATMAPLVSYGQKSSSSMNRAIESALSLTSFRHPSLISSYAVEPWPTVKEHSMQCQLTYSRLSDTMRLRKLRKY